MSGDSLLSSHRAGKLLQVNPSSINKWVEAGLIPAFRTPGGHRRIRARDLVAFLRGQQMPIPPSLRAAGTPRVLWVDDDARFLRSLERALTRYADRLELTLLGSGIDALLEVGALRPDLIVLDVMMPEVNGIEVCGRLRARDDLGATGVVFVSGQSDARTRRAAMEAGALAFLIKPIRIEEVLSFVGVAPTVEAGG